MDESDESLSVDGMEEYTDYFSDEEDSVGSSPENGRLNLSAKEDRISALPDSLIQHIISPLPSTKEAIQTGILSKRWQNQWSRVPVLIFSSSGMDDENFSQFIDRTLVMHDCPKLKKFQIQYYCRLWPFHDLNSKIRFAARKQVEELILHIYSIGLFRKRRFPLPDFLCKNDALVKLELFNCYFPPCCTPYWPSLKELKLKCFSLYLNDVNTALAGSPSLELLELTRPRFVNDAIVSESLKRLIIIDAVTDARCAPVAISCPNLVEFSFKKSETPEFGFPKSPDQTIESVLSSCPALHTLELQSFTFSRSSRIVIASKSLKKLVLGGFCDTPDFEISCPSLEESNLFGFLPGFNLPRCSAMKMLLQLQHVKLLEIGCRFVEILSALEIEGQSCLGLNCKFLTLDGTNFGKFFPGIICAIRSSRVLEKLTINFPCCKHQSSDLLSLNLQYLDSDPRDLDGDGEDRWNSYGAVFKSLELNLKTVKIVGLSGEDDNHTAVFNFVELLLRNSRVLEKLVIVLAKCRTRFAVEVSRKLLGFQKCYPRTCIVLCDT